MIEKVKWVVFEKGASYRRGIAAYDTKEEAEQHASRSKRFEVDEVKEFSAEGDG